MSSFCSSGLRDTFRSAYSIHCNTGTPTISGLLELLFFFADSCHLTSLHRFPFGDDYKTVYAAQGLFEQVNFSLQACALVPKFLKGQGSRGIHRFLICWTLNSSSRYVSTLSRCAMSSCPYCRYPSRLRLGEIRPFASQ